MRFFNLPEVGDEVILGVTIPKLDGSDKDTGCFTSPIGSNKGSFPATKNEISIESLD